MRLFLLGGAFVHGMLSELMALAIGSWYAARS